MSKAFLNETAHRPWPMPSSPWIMGMQWRDLLFAHWPLPVAALRDLIPRDLEIDTFEGEAWVGVVPLTMANVHARCLPKMRDFPELNLRTYVRYRDKPGVWFFSLDAHSPFAVWSARTFFHLPYFKARMSCEAMGDSFNYHSDRYHQGAALARFTARYRPTGDVSLSQPDTLEQFLTERYCLYTVDPNQRIRCGEIHHLPWPLQPAEIEIETNTLATASGFELPDCAPHCLYARELDVVAWFARTVLS